MRVLLAAVVALAAFGSGDAVPTVRAAASVTGVFLSQDDGSGPTTLQVFRPPDAIVTAEWNGVWLTVHMESAGSGVRHDVYLAPPDGQALAPGTYDAPGSVSMEVQGTACASALTIQGIDPVPQPGIALASLSTLAATFSLDCGTTERRGDIRIASPTGLRAIGLAEQAAPAYATTLRTAPAFVGRTSEVGALILKNHGTTPVTFGSRSISAGAASRWMFASDSCSGKVLAPGSTCQISATSRSWVPGGYGDYLTLPVDAGLTIRVYLASTATAGRFVAIDPTRLVDTRRGLGIAAALPHRVSRTFRVVDRAPGDAQRNIPAEAVALVGNLTITGQTSGGYVSLLDVPSANPTTSTVNVRVGETLANGTIVRLDTNGTAALTWVGSAGSTADAVFDATGYFVPSEGPTPVDEGNFRTWLPTRVLDSRTGTGFAGALKPGVPKIFTVPLVGVDQQSEAVTGNLTITGATGNGYVTIGPTPVVVPTTSTLNFVKGDTRANNVIVRMSPGKQLSLTYRGPPGTSVHVVLDITGTFGSGHAGFVPLVPSRIADSRIGQGVSGKLVADHGRMLVVEDRYPADPSRNVPPDVSGGQHQMHKVAISGNVTLVRPTASGYLALYPDGATLPPTTSTINAPAASTRANGHVTGGPNSPIMLGLYYHARPNATTHVVVDVTGYFLD